jgi:DNA repair protein RecO (recombination protein O)
LDTRYIKTDGIVLHSTQFGEGHKIIHLFTEGYGKIEASAFGVRKTKSRFGSKLERFTISHFFLYHKSASTLYSIKDVEVHNQNDLITADYEKYIAGNALLESVVLFVERAQPDEKLYSLLCEALQVLNALHAERSVYLLSMYDVQFLSIMGYSPNLRNCIRCGKELEDSEHYIHHYEGFPLCRGCKTASCAKVRESVLRFIEWALVNPLTLSSKVKMEKDTLAQVRAVIDQLYLHTFHKTPGSWSQLPVYR